MAYNVHGLENKLFHLDFFKHIEGNDIFMLLETHVEEKSIAKFENRFKMFNITWTPATRSSIYGRAIGGLVCGVRKDLSNSGISHSFKTCVNVNLIQIRTRTTEFTILPVYLRGSNWDRDFEDLKMCMQFNNVVNPIIMGDLNVRIGEEQQILDENILANFPAGLELRQSKDKTINSNGRKFLEYCKDQGMVILNGRTLGDEEGRHTFISSVGSSVNDICAVSMNNLDIVEYFDVGGQIWSDHLPINLGISANASDMGMEKIDLLPKLRWHHQRKEGYKIRLGGKLKALKERKPEPVIKDLTNLIIESYEYPTKRESEKHYKNKWFDWKCDEAREKSMNFLSLYRKSQNENDKEKYIQCKKDYQNLCKRKRKEYFESIEVKLNTVTDSKQWWTLAREIRQQQNYIGNQITADTFRNYFENLLNPIVRVNDISYAANQIIDQQLDRAFSLQEVKDQLNRSKPNKAPGVDRIPYEFFINAPDEYLEEMARTFTRLLNCKDSYESFQKSVIFPIHKKGDTNQPGNYRGISFMNCIGKTMMGMVNERITNWVNRNHVLNEYQAGFRKGYSTIDNIYSLQCIVKLKMAENKKVFAFFVDFKAAFDRIPRNLLTYKLHQMGISTKVLNFIENVYQNTTAAVWTGRELSNDFETGSGVKQGCLLSPLLFSLYLNDLHEYLEGGLFIDNMNIRVLMYADDIVMLADDVNILQKMICNLEKYCLSWGMEVNLSKSEILIFRKGGRISRNEAWTFNGEVVRIAKEYKYLGITLTPKMSFAKHVAAKNDAAKVSLNATWKHFIGRKEVSLRAKWKMFLAVSRSIQSYGAQVWGNSWFEEIDKLQRYFTKRILRLPENTPNYVLALETAQEETHFYTYGLHLKYISKTIFDYGNHRLPYKLSQKIVAKDICWYKELKIKLDDHHVSTHNLILSKETWNNTCANLFDRMKESLYEYHIHKSQQSLERIYKNLDSSKGISYCVEKYNQEQISYIMRARGDILWLNGNTFGDVDARLCSLCNLREVENSKHFIGKCPVLNEIRIRFLKRVNLTDEEIHHVLNGGENLDWMGLINYIKYALKYRNTLVMEFNY